MAIVRNSRKTPNVLLFVFIAFILTMLSFFQNQLKLVQVISAKLDAPFEISVEPPQQFAERIIVIVPPIGNQILSPLQVAMYDLDTIRTLLRSIENARYSTKISLNIVLVPESNASAFDQRYSIVQKIHWIHGTMQVTNATSGGSFEMILSAWTPQENAREQIVLIDAAFARNLNVDWFDILQITRSRYGVVPDVAAFTTSAIPNRLHSSISRLRSFWKSSLPWRNSDDEICLYQSAAYLPILAPKSAEQWRSFQRWFIARRAEWFMWPNVVNPKNLNDKEWKGFNARSRAHWTMWYTRFLAEYGMYIVYRKKIDSKLSNTDSYQGSSDSLMRVSFDGQVHLPKIENGATPQEELEEIVHMAKQAGGKVALTVVTNTFLETAQSWICNVKVAGFSPSATVWIAPEKLSYNLLKNVNGSRAIHMKSFKGGREKSGTDFLSPGYWLLMLERTRLIRDLLERGVGVFAFETDQIWLRDPVPTISRIIESGDGVDLVGTLDTRNQIAGNFLYIAPTIASKKLWREVARRFSGAYHTAGMHLRHFAKFRRYIQNDQSLLTHLVFYDTEFKRKNPVVFRALDTRRFVDGRWYWGTKYYGKTALSPTIINNNFLIGIAKKKDRAEKHGHWFLTGGVCDAAKVVRAIRENEARKRVYEEERNSTFSSNAESEEDLFVGIDEVIRGISKAITYP